MSAIESAKAHFASLETQSFEVKEWKDEVGKPLVIYHTPMTLHEKDRLYKRAKGESLELMAYVLIYKAVSETGEPLFTMDDKFALMNSVDPDVLSEASAKLLNNSSVEEQLEK
jgi:hypothetical protein|tara:strand:- start:177 stop:515 length:339 start_codon:yes stop_codon:yes gene_type:complete